MRSLIHLLYFVWSFIILQITDTSGVQTILPQDPLCHGALGLHDEKIISNSRISTPEGSTDAVQSGKEGYYARFNNPQAWCINFKDSKSKSDDEFKDNVYVQINFPVKTKITAITLQGWKAYGYGNHIRLAYDLGGGLSFVNYKQKNGATDIPVDNLKGNDYQYLVLDQDITTKNLRIKLQFGSNTKCLRAELYGCQFENRLLEYKKCPATNQTLLTERLLSENNVKYITESAKVRTHDFDGEKILFSQPLAWCVKKGNIPTNVYEEWMQINMRDEYLLYGLKVNGYKNPQKSHNSENDTDDYITESIKFKYSLDSVHWAWYEGGRAIPTADYRSDMLVIHPPLVAKFVMVFMKINDTSNNCLKLQLYGCEGVLYDESLTPTPSLTNNTNNNNTNTPTTTPTMPAVKARVIVYMIPQGMEYSDTVSWKDRKYTGKENHEGKLSNGKGCLIDKEDSSEADPLKDPTCWVGWKKSNITQPYVTLETTRTAVFTGLVIRTYINEDIDAKAILKFTIEYSPSVELTTTLGYICAPPSVYHISPGVVDFRFKLDNIRAQYVTVMFQYSGEWILIRQVTLEQGPLIQPERYLTLSKTPVKCQAPAKEEAKAPPVEDSENVVVIVCVVLGMLLLLVLALLMYHFRQNLHHVFKARTGQPILKSNYVKASDKSTVYKVHDNRGYDKMNVQPFLNRCNGTAEEVYAAPEITSIGSNNSIQLLDVNTTQYAQYNVISDQPDGGAYAEPNSKMQYAEPNSTAPEDPIYQGSVIYAQSYKSPYQAVVASSMYADPEKVKGTSTLRQIPRRQLTLKEKIGVGQFGEVHIAEATGLDEIYGNLGHYNSWGLPDTGHVALKVLKSEDEAVEKEFMKEVEVMAQLKHENVVRLLGICQDKPMIMVCEYMENGDLNQFLQKRNPCDEQNVRASMIPPDVLLSDSLLHMAQQIAAGMKYLHAEGFIHRDLATRNCLVGPAYQVKVADFGMSRYLYSKQYYRIEGKAILPIRWMAPECMFYGKFTNCTDVWSFGVTLWEIFGFARQSPYEEITDPQVIERSCTAIQHPKAGFECLHQPVHSPPEMYKLMQNCWQMEPENRPSFAYIYRFITDLCNSTEGEI